jgi:tetratricopeptide (TPR) repeat protein
MRKRFRRLVLAASLVVSSALAVVFVVPRDAPHAADGARAAARLAAQRLVAGETADARRLAERALASDPRDVDARFVRAVLASMRGDRAGAVVDLEACAEAEPTNYVACLEAGIVASPLDADDEAARGRARKWFAEASARACAALVRDPGDARAAIVDASACLALGRLDDAQRRLDLLGEPTGPLADDAAALRAALLVARGRDVDARALLRRAVAGNGSRASAAMLAALDAAPGALVHAGVDAARRGDRVAARVFLADAARMSPDDLTPVVLLAAVLVGPDAARAAGEESRRLASLDPHGASSPFLVANVLLASGDADGASTLFRRALDRAPDDVAVLGGAVLAELTCDRATTAVALCRARLSRGAAPGVVDLLLGAALEHEGDVAGAESSYRDALRKDAADWLASDRLAELLLARGDVAGAAAACDAGLSADAACLPLRVRRADVCVAAGDAARTVEMLAAEARARPACGVVLLHWARALVAAGDRRGAADRFDECLRADPSCVEAQVGAVSLASADGTLADVVERLRTRAASRPTDPVPRFALGVAAETCGDFAAAEREYRAALSLAPRFGVAANNLAWLLAERLGRPADARPFAEAAGRLLPRNPHVLDTRGWVRLKTGDAAGAEPDLARAARMLPARRDVAARHVEAFAALRRSLESQSLDAQPVPESTKESPR